MCRNFTIRTRLKTGAPSRMLHDCFFFSNYHLTSLSFKDNIFMKTEWRKICKNNEKLETDKTTAPRLRASHTTQLATNCLYKTSLPEDSAYVNISSQCFYKQSKDPTDRYGQYYIMDKIHWTYFDKQHQTYKKCSTQELGFLDGQSYQLCLQALD